MIRTTPRSTRKDTLFPNTMLVRSNQFSPHFVQPIVKVERFIAGRPQPFHQLALKGELLILVGNRLTENSRAFGDQLSHARLTCTPAIATPDRALLQPAQDRAGPRVQRPIVAANDTEAGIFGGSCEFVAKPGHRIEDGNFSERGIRTPRSEEHTS